MTIDDLMKQVASKHQEVCVICTDGDKYIGKVAIYTKADDEECGIPSICIQLDETGGVCLFEDEIEKIEFIDE